MVASATTACRPSEVSLPLDPLRGFSPEWAAHKKRPPLRAALLVSVLVGRPLVIHPAHAAPSEAWRRGASLLDFNQWNGRR